MSPGGYKARYTPGVSPDTLDKEGISLFFNNLLFLATYYLWEIG